LTLTLGQGAPYSSHVTEPAYKIHALATLAGVTVKTLHHYDRVGLLQPRRTAARYRLYTTADLTRLRQILALRSLGLPLRRIRELLAPGAPPLHLALRQQRYVLETQRRLLDRTISALAAAEKGLEASPGATSDTWHALLEVIGMQDSVDEMRKYYSDEVWNAWRHHYESWPAPVWRELYRDVNDLLDAGEPVPTSVEAQALGSRWLALDRAETTVSAIRTGLRKAWADREHWPEALRAQLEAHRVDRATRFINAVLWERWESERAARERAGSPAPARVSDARRDLYRDCAAALATGRAQAQAPALVARWKAIVDTEVGGDAELAAEHVRAWRGRHAWPPGLVRYMASCYDMNAETWQRVADFFDAAAGPSAA
jgi:MerR family transcriptional regulator, thiopeptide resistance regulator